MNKNRSFRSRLIISFLAVIFVSLVLFTWFARSALNREVLSETKTAAIRQLNMIAGLIENDLAFSDAKDMDAWFERTGASLGVRLTFVDDSGTVLADSEVAFGKVSDMEDHSGRPEILDARSGGVGVSVRDSGTLGVKLIYAAKTIDPGEALGKGTLRLSVPFSSVSERLSRMIVGLLAAGGATFVLALVLSFLLSRRLGHSIKELSSAAEAMGTGNLSMRIRSYPGEEFEPLVRAINRMAENLQEHLKTVTLHKEQLEAMLNGMNEGVMVLDGQGRISRVNRAFSHIFPGISEWRGRKPIEVLMNLDVQKACDRALSGESGRNVVQTILIEPSRGRIYEVNVASFADTAAGLGVIVVFHDISRLKHLERVRRDFVANVSHELRTPLTSIRGYAETYLSGEVADQADVKEFFSIILRNSEHMSEIVENLLTLSAIERDDAGFTLVPVDAGRVLASAWEQVGGAASAVKIRLDNRLPDELAVMADEGGLVRVFVNLLENAIRYGAGQSVIEVFHRVEGDKVVIGVSDQGPGIPRQEQERIFERFYRLDRSRSSESVSSGLGLAIVKNIIARHGGDVWVESPVPGRDAGSVFFIRLQGANAA